MGSDSHNQLLRQLTRRGRVLSIIFSAEKNSKGSGVRFPQSTFGCSVGWGRNITKNKSFNHRKSKTARTSKSDPSDLPSEGKSPSKASATEGPQKSTPPFVHGAYPDESGFPSACPATAAVQKIPFSSPCIRSGGNLNLAPFARGDIFNPSRLSRCRNEPEPATNQRSPGVVFSRAAIQVCEQQLQGDMRAWLLGVLQRGAAGVFAGDGSGLV